MTCPRPPHVGHTCENENGPWSTAIEPAPWHCGHVSGIVPGAAPDPWHVEHVASARNRTVLRDAADRVVERQVQLGLEVLAALRPGRARRCAARPPPPPNRLPKMSPRAAAPSRRRSGTSGRRRAAEPPGRSRRRRDRRRTRPSAGPRRTPCASSVSPSTSYAAEISLKRSSAVLVAGVRVGVVLLGELLVGARDLLVGRASGTPSTA